MASGERCLVNQEEIMQQLQAGMQALQSGNLDTAEDIFRNILSLNSSEVHSLHFLGVVFCQKGNLDDGISLIEQSIRLDPSRFGPYLNMGRFLVGANQWDRAVAALEQAIQRDASSFDAWSMLAQASFFAGNADAALKAGKKAAEINPGNAEIFFSLGVYATETNKDEAIDYYRRAVSIDPASFKAWVNLGNCLLDCQRVEDSIAAFDEALKSNPSCFQALMSLSRAYGDRGKWLEALDMSKQALIVDSSSHDAAFWVGYSLHKLDRKKEAVNAYRMALTISPVSAQTHLYLASALEGIGEDQYAIEHYELATKVNPKLSLAFTYWGALLQKYGDLSLAIEKFRRAVDSDLSSADAYLGLGTALNEVSQYEEAIASYRKAIEVKPNFADAYLNLGVVLKEEGQVEEAGKYLLSAVKIEPTLRTGFYQLFDLLLDADRDNEEVLLNNLSSAILRSTSKQEIIAFGDCHVGVFEDIPGFDRVWIGAATAYNLIKSQSSTRGREKILKRLESADPRSSAVLLSFGEVDCRSNILKYCIKLGMSIDAVCADVLRRYFEFVGEIMTRGFDVVLYGPWGSGSDHNNQGNTKERYYAALCIEKMLRHGARERGIPFFSLHGVLNNSSLQKTRLEFFDDDLHFHGHETDDISSDVKCMVLSRMLEAVNETDSLSLSVAPPEVNEVSLLGESSSCLLDVFSVEKPVFHRLGLLLDESARVNVLSQASKSIVVDLGACLNVEDLKASFSASSAQGIEIWGLDNNGDKADSMIKINSHLNDDSIGVRLNAAFPPCSMLRYLVVTCPEGLLSTLVDFDVIGQSFVF